MILADTGIWIDYFNGKDTIFTTALDAELTAGAVVLGDLIFLEILQGFRNDKDFRQAKAALSTLDLYEMFGHYMVYKCADNYRKLRKKGITIRRSTDVIIASFCIENRLPLLFQDRDFIPFVTELGLTPVLKET